MHLHHSFHHALHHAAGPHDPCQLLQDQYIELTTAIPTTSAIYGLGERTPSTGMQLLRQGIPITLWNRDAPAADPDENNYGSRPNYLQINAGDALPSSCLRAEARI